MKKNKTILFATLIIGFIAFAGISGCKPEDTLPATCTNGVKDGDETDVDCGGSCSACTGGTARIKTYTWSTNPVSTDNITYDGSGRQLEYHGAVEYTSYIYNGNTIIKNRNYNNSGNGVIEETEYTLNPQGYAASYITRYSSGAVYDVWYHQLTYDADWHLLTNVGTDSITGNWVDSLVYTWSGNNQTSSYYKDIFLTNPDIHNYTYLTGKLNTLGNDNWGLSFLGKSSVNLVGTDSGSGSSNTLQYEYDSYGRVTKRLPDYGEYTYY